MNEKIYLYEPKKHWISYIIPLILLTIGSFGLLSNLLYKGTLQISSILYIYFLFIGTKNLIKIINTKISLSENYLSISQGIFGRTITDISLEKLEGIEFSQNFIGKKLNFGMLIVKTGNIHQKYVIRDPTILREKVLKK